jgi:hypothetical protein
MFRKTMQCLLALTVVLGLAVAVISQPAEARRGGSIAAGVAVGTILGLGIAGAYDRGYYYSGGPGCFRGPRQCQWVGRSCWYNRYGEYVCRGGDYRCWRPLICD